MINVELIPIKYITGTYKFEKQYPTAEDLLWDIVTIGKKTLPVEQIDWIDEDKKDELLKHLSDNNYIKIANNKISILKTDWDGRRDQ